MPNLDERFRTVEEMLQLYSQSVPEQRVKGFLRHLQKIPTEKLKLACAGCVEHGSQRGAPTVAEIIRRAMEVGTRRSSFDETDDEGPRYRECKRVVHATRFGKLLCCCEEGHMGECRVWFDHNGLQAEDAEVIRRLMESEGKVIPLHRPEELLEDIL
jgi:hypothetical protein